MAPSNFVIVVGSVVATDKVEIRIGVDNRVIGTWRLRDKLGEVRDYAPFLRAQVKYFNVIGRRALMPAANGQEDLARISLRILE